MRFPGPPASAATGRGPILRALAQVDFTSGAVKSTIFCDGCHSILIRIEQLRANGTFNVSYILEAAALPCTATGNVRNVMAPELVLLAVGLTLWMVGMFTAVPEQDAAGQGLSYSDGQPRSESDKM